MTPFIWTGIAAGLTGGAIAIAVIAALLGKPTRSRTREPVAKKKHEFSKVILGIYSFACIAWITADYVLAFKHRQPVNTEVTVTLTTTVVIAILGYYVKSAGEKVCRNISKVDENGKPYFSSDSSGSGGGHGEQCFVEQYFNGGVDGNYRYRCRSG